MSHLRMQTFGNNDYTELNSINDTIITKCSLGIKNLNAYTCAYEDGSTNNIKINCDGKSEYIISTICPKRSRLPTCNVMTQSGKCTLKSYDNNQVECLCDICYSSNSRRMLVGTSEPVVTQVSAGTVFSFKDYSSTISQSESNKISLIESIQDAAIVLISFIVIWVLVILLVPLKSYIYRNRSKVALEPESRESMTSSTLREYIYKYLPIYHDDIDYVSKIIKQMTRKHLYYDFVTDNDKDKDFSVKYINAFKILTHMSLYMFVLAILFEVQFPENNSSTFSFQALLLLALIQQIISAPIDAIIRYHQ